MSETLLRVGPFQRPFNKSFIFITRKVSILHIRKSSSNKHINKAGGSLNFSITRIANYFQTEDNSKYFTNYAV